jgi:hypothetical protein
MGARRPDASRSAKGTLRCVLAVVTLRQHAGSADAGSLITVGKSLIAIKNWTFLLGPGFVDGIGTGLILGWLMYLVRPGVTPPGALRRRRRSSARRFRDRRAVWPDPTTVHVARHRDRPGGHLGGVPRLVAHLQGVPSGRS